MILRPAFGIIKAMPEQIFKGSGHEMLEEDMHRLAAEVLAHRERPENRGVGDEELLKRSLQGIAPTGEEPESPSRAAPLPAYTQEISDEMKLEIEHLLDLAFHEGIMKANEAAKKSSPYLIDAFHDSLVGRLYPELKKRGLL